VSIFFEGTADDGTHVVVRGSGYQMKLFENGVQYPGDSMVNTFRDGGSVRIALDDGREFYASRKIAQPHYTIFDGKVLHERDYSNPR
jgi:hypothetical protein